jgi:aminopeptidase N
MADKLMNPLFPAIDHDLAFLLKHHPLAYGVDRSAGANPIRQRLDNLEEAGQMYGNIIYHKSPVMMRQLELIMGEDAFRSGLREYLQRFAWGNATWPELVAILDKRSGLDLGDWSKVWVESAGRPTFGIETAAGAGTPGTLLAQSDPAGRGRIWPQQFAAAAPPYTAAAPVVSDRHRVPMAANTSAGSLLNADGGGYGLFPPRPELFEAWDQLPALIRGALLVDSYENLEEGRLGAPAPHLQRLIAILEVESDQLLLREALRHLKRVYLVLLEEAARSQFRDSIEETLWRGVTGSGDDSLKRLFYDGFTALASSPDALRRLHAIWEEQSPPPGLALEESDYIELAELLAIQLPARAKQIVAAQAARMVNPDARRRLAFIAPSLSPDPAARDAFFHSLAQPGNRETELWVINALARLHHPSRLTHSERYLQRTLELLEEIQRTGDIFFPSKWLEASLALHASPAAAGTVRAFIAARPGYNAQLRMKILQEADPLFRACRIRHGAAC